ncbi:MAG: sigma 54-interacting transcriptional regulator, partial [Eubacterium sp.]
MDRAMQAKLLRVLQEQEIERIGGLGPIKINVRVIAATNAPLEKLMESKDFRKDLYYRLNVISVILPPLRQRKGDIPL